MQRRIVQYQKLEMCNYEENIVDKKYTELFTIRSNTNHSEKAIYIHFFAFDTKSKTGISDFGHYLIFDGVM